MRAGVPVIPIAVVGAEESMPIMFKVADRRPRRWASPTSRSPPTCSLLGPLLGAVGYFPAKFKLRVLPPVHFDVEPDQERYSRSRVMDEAESIRVAAPGDALRHAPSARKSIWFG